MNCDLWGNCCIVKNSCCVVKVSVVLWKMLLCCEKFLLCCEIFCVEVWQIHATVRSYTAHTVLKKSGRAYPQARPATTFLHGAL